LYAYERRGDGNRCIIALNRSKLEQTVALPVRLTATELLSNTPVTGGELVVPARQAAILRVEA
jgi:hypothetical protein